MRAVIYALEDLLVRNRTCAVGAPLGRQKKKPLWTLVVMALLSGQRRSNTMEIERNEWIARRAYELWEQAGHPVGQDDQHWSEASAEWEQAKAGTSNPSDAWDDED